MRHLVDWLKTRLAPPSGEARAAPMGEPSYVDAEMYAHKRDWPRAVEEYRRVAADHPLDAECLWRMADIYDRRLDDGDRYLQTLRRTVLVTTGADWLYRKHGFADVPEGVGFMQLHRPNIYTAASA